MRARLLSPLLFLALVPFASATEPPASIDDQIAKLIAKKAQKAALEKEITALEDDLRKSAKDLIDKLAANGIVIGPPVPVDPLVTSVAAAYKADPSVGKASDARALALVYRTIVSQMNSIGTTDTLLATINSMTKAELSGRLGTVTPFFGRDFVAHVPAGSVAMTAAQKTEVSETLTRYAGILDGLTKQ